MSNKDDLEGPTSLIVSLKSPWLGRSLWSWSRRADKTSAFWLEEVELVLVICSTASADPSLKSGNTPQFYIQEEDKNFTTECIKKTKQGGLCKTVARIPSKCQRVVGKGSTLVVFKSIDLARWQDGHLVDQRPPNPLGTAFNGSACDKIYWIFEYTSYSSNCSHNQDNQCNHDWSALIIWWLRPWCCEGRDADQCLHQSHPPAGDTTALCNIRRIGHIRPDSRTRVNRYDASTHHANVVTPDNVQAKHNLKDQIKYTPNRFPRKKTVINAKDLFHPLGCTIYPLMSLIQDQVDGLVKALK